jgi:hypothetical protein
MKNNYIYRFPLDPKTGVSNEHDSQTFLNQEEFKFSTTTVPSNHKNFRQFHSLPQTVNRQQPTKIRNEIVHKRLQSTHKSLLENEAFLNKIIKPKSYNYATRNLFKRRVPNSTKTNRISQATSKKLTKNHKKINIKNMVYDAVTPASKAVRKFQFRPSWTSLQDVLF